MRVGLRKRAGELRRDGKARENKGSDDSTYRRRDLWEHPEIIKTQATWGKRFPGCVCGKNIFRWAESIRWTSQLIFGTDVKGKSSEINSKSLNCF